MTWRQVPRRRFSGDWKGQVLSGTIDLRTNVYRARVSSIHTLCALDFWLTVITTHKLKGRGFRFSAKIEIKNSLILISFALFREILEWINSELV